MKETIKQPNVLQRTTERITKLAEDRPSLRTGALHRAYALGGFVLSGAEFLQAPLPLAVCLVGVLPIGAPALAALIGTIAGCCAFWVGRGLQAPGEGRTLLGRRPLLCIVILCVSVL